MIWLGVFALLLILGINITVATMAYRLEWSKPHLILHGFLTGVTFMNLITLIIKTL